MLSRVNGYIIATDRNFAVKFYTFSIVLLLVDVYMENCLFHNLLEI